MTNRNASIAGNLAHMLWDAATSVGERTALVDGVSVTYSDLKDHAEVIGGTLVRNGLEPDQRVVVLLPRGSEAAAAFFGVLAVGGVAVLANETLRAGQVEHIIRHSRASVVVTSRSALARLRRPLDADARIVDIDDVRSGRSMRPTSRIASDVAQIIYTSGSTGRPKGVTLSHGNLWEGVSAVIEYLAITESDRIASLLPFGFDYGLNQLLCAIGSHATLVIERSPVAARIARTLRETGVTILSSVPPQWLQLLGTSSFVDVPIGSLRVMTNTGGRLPTDAVRRLRNSQPHADLVLMYGLTEAFRSTYLTPSKTDLKPTSIGTAIPGAEILVLRDDLTSCAPGEIGQLVHRGPTVALGYWDDPHATAEVFRSHPLRPSGAPDAERVVFSGDLVSSDEDGDLTFVGRKDALIKVLGYRVSPDEVVEALHASDEVTEAAVTSEPDELMGARVVAHVVLKEPDGLARLQDHCRRELPRHMQPARFDVRRSLPRTASGKFDLSAIGGTVR